MRRKDIKGKIKFIYDDEKKKLEKDFLRTPLKDFSLPAGFIQGVYSVSGLSSYLSVLRSDSADSPNWLNIDEYQIVSLKQLTNKSLFIGPYKTKSYHHTTPEKLKKINPYILLSA